MVVLRYPALSPTIMERAALQKCPFPKTMFSIKALLRKNSLTSRDTFYYLCAERIGPRPVYELSGNPSPEIGHKGEFMGHMLAAQSNKKVLKNRHFPFHSGRNASFQAQLNLWLSYIVPNMEASAEILLKPQDSAFVKFIHKGHPQNPIVPTNTGFGISYFLPILGCCLLAPENSMIIIENPEAHLSPKGQSGMGLFLGCMANAGLKVIVETHSDHIINGIRLAVKKNYIGSEKILFNYFSLLDGETSPTIKPIKIDKNSKLDSWPPGFFDQMDQDLITLNRPAPTS